MSTPKVVLSVTALGVLIAIIATTIGAIHAISNFEEAAPLSFMVESQLEEPVEVKAIRVDHDVDTIVGYVHLESGEQGTVILEDRFTKLIISNQKELHAKRILHTPFNKVIIRKEGEHLVVDFIVANINSTQPTD